MEIGENKQLILKKPETGRIPKASIEKSRMWLSSADWNAEHRGQLLGPNGFSPMCPHT